MELKTMFDNYEASLINMKNNLNGLEKDYSEAKQNTIDFLKICEEEGIKAVSIGKRTKLIKSASGWNYCRNMIFADETEEKGTWPAIWKAGDRMGINDGCGNGGQHQANVSRLSEGVYQFKEGKWYMVQEND